MHVVCVQVMYDITHVCIADLGHDSMCVHPCSEIRNNSEHDMPYDMINLIGLAKMATFRNSPPYCNDRRTITSIQAQVLRDAVYTIPPINHSSGTDYMPSWSRIRAPAERTAHGEPPHSNTGIPKCQHCVSFSSARTTISILVWQNPVWLDIYPVTSVALCDSHSPAFTAVLQLHLPAPLAPDRRIKHTEAAWRTERKRSVRRMSSDSEAPDPVCYTRADYRAGRKETAVRVYTVNQESRWRLDR